MGYNQEAYDADCAALARASKSAARRQTIPGVRLQKTVPTRRPSRSFCGQTLGRRAGEGRTDTRSGTSPIRGAASRFWIFLSTTDVGRKLQKEDPPPPHGGGEVGPNAVLFDKEATRWLGFWLESQLIL